MLSRKAIEEYKKIYKNHFGVDLSDEEASFRANNLVDLYKAVYENGPIGMEPSVEASKYDSP